MKATLIRPRVGEVIFHRVGMVEITPKLLYIMKDKISNAAV